MVGSIGFHEGHSTHRTEAYTHEECEAQPCAVETTIILESGNIDDVGFERLALSLTPFIGPGTLRAGGLIPQLKHE